jgi:hypothetical protein
MSRSSAFLEFSPPNVRDETHLYSVCMSALGEADEDEIAGAAKDLPRMTLVAYGICLH